MAPPKSHPQTVSPDSSLLRIRQHQSSSGKILVIEKALPVSCSTADFLRSQGFQSERVNGLAEVMKHARILMPAAVIIDLDLPTVGTDHAIRVIRLVHPAVPLLALSSTLERRIAELVSEFHLPILSTPCTHAALLAALELLGVCRVFNSAAYAAD